VVIVCCWWLYSCEIGYWGNPLVIGGQCEKCECSDNIDLRDPLSCDQSTGECVRCINHAAGEHCERCMDWYFGDAIHRKNCQRTLPRLHSSFNSFTGSLIMYLVECRYSC